MKCRGLQKTQLVSELMLGPTQLSVQKLEEEGQSIGHGAVRVHPQWNRRMTQAGLKLLVLVQQVLSTAARS